MKINNCKFCDGSGFIPVVRESSLTKLKTIVKRECYCLRSSKVSSNPAYPLLSFLGDLYLAPNEYDSSLKIEVQQNLKDIPSYRIEGTDDYSFNLHIKSVIMDHDFGSERPLSIYYNSSIKVVQDFYVKPSEEASISDLREKYDLVILSFGTDEKNDAMPTCLCAVINNRKQARKPTWIYIPPHKTLSTCSEVMDREKRSFLDLFESYLTDFKDISLVSKIAPEGISNTKNIQKQFAAADFNS